MQQQHASIAYERDTVKATLQEALGGLMRHHFTDIFTSPAQLDSWIDKGMAHVSQRPENDTCETPFTAEDLLKLRAYYQRKTRFGGATNGHGTAMTLILQACDLTFEQLYGPEVCERHSEPAPPSHSEPAPPTGGLLPGYLNRLQAAALAENGPYGICFSKAWSALQEEAEKTPRAPDGTVTVVLDGKAVQMGYFHIAANRYAWYLHEDSVPTLRELVDARRSRRVSGSVVAQVSLRTYVPENFITRNDMAEQANIPLNATYYRAAWDKLIAQTEQMQPDAQGQYQVMAGMQPVTIGYYHPGPVGRASWCMAKEDAPAMLRFTESHKSPRGKAPRAGHFENAAAPAMAARG